MNVPYSKLTGDTRDRPQQIDSFQLGENKVFLISLKAGGVGLNLTAADTVIHFDPWWNPAAENQATDRAHRIGQDKPVFVYKLIAEGSLEEKILLLQEKKAELARGILEGGLTSSTALTNEDLNFLFAPLGDSSEQKKLWRKFKTRETIALYRTSKYARQCQKSLNLLSRSDNQTPKLTPKYARHLHHNLTTLLELSHKILEYFLRHNFESCRKKFERFKKFGNSRPTTFLEDARNVFSSFIKCL